MAAPPTVAGLLSTLGPNYRLSATSLTVTVAGPLAGAGNDDASAYRANMVAAGLPANFFVVNPDVSASTVVTNGPSTKYNGIQLILNRRYADGFQVQTSYTYSKGFQSDFYSWHKPYVEREQNYSNGSASLGDVRHNLAVNWVYDLPFGRGRKWGAGTGDALNRLIGDWSIMGLLRWQSGRMVDYGNVRLVGMTKEDVRNAARSLGLANWDKPSSACLASRVPYGTRITEVLLGRIERAEDAVRSRGVGQLRVRSHGDIARIEVPTMWS